MWWRSATAGTLLAAGVLFAGHSRAARSTAGGRVDRGTALPLALATVAQALVNLTIFAAFQRVTVAVALIAFYAYPALVALGGALFFGERLDRVRMSSLVVASGGLVLVVLTPVLVGTDVRLDPLGVALALTAAVSQSVYVLLGAHAYRSVPAVRVSAVFAIGSAGLYLVLLVLTGGLSSIALPLERPALWPWILAASVTGAALPSIAILAGIRRIGATRAAILMMLEPVAGVLLAAFLLGETPLPLQLVGGAAVIAAGVALQVIRGGRTGVAGPEAEAPEAAPTTVPWSGGVRKRAD